MHARLRRPTALLAVIAIAVVLVALVTLRYQQARQDNDDLRGHRMSERIESDTKLLGETIGATFFEADVVHDLARLLTEARIDGDEPAEQQLRAYLSPARGLRSPDIGQVAVIGADGMLMWSNLSWHPVPTDLSDREHFQMILRDPTLERAIGRPVIGRVSREPTVQTVRPIRDEHGKLLAVSVVSVRVNMLERLCRDLALGPDDEVLLLRGDGLVLMSRDLKHLGEMVPQTFMTADVFAPGKRLAAHNGPFDRMGRYIVTRQVSGMPLYVLVGLSKATQDAALTAVQETLWHWTLFLDLSIVAVAVAGTVVLAIARRSETQTERAAGVARSEAWLRSVLDDIPEGILVANRVGPGEVRIAYANAGVGQIIGTQAEDLAGARWLDFVHPDERSLVAERIRAVLDNQSLPIGTYRVVRMDGTIRHVRENRSRIRTLDDAEHVRMITLLHDVTEEYEREAALAAAHTRIERILQIVPGIFYQMVAEPGEPPVIQFVSESVREIFGVSPEEAVRPGWLVKRAGVDLIAERTRALERAGPSNIAALAYPVRFGDREIWVRDTLRATSLPDGRLEIVGFLTDITAEHATTEALQTAEMALRRSNRVLTAYSRSLGALIHSGTGMETVAKVCESIITEPGFVLAWVGVVEDAPGDPIRIVASVGDAAGYVDGLTLSWSPDTPFGRGPGGKAIRTGRANFMRDSETDPSFAPWRERARRYGVRSTVCVPFKYDGRVQGMVVIYASEPDAFGPEDVELFQRLADEIGFVIKLEGDRARMEAADVARLAAETNLRAAALLGPGILYRGRVTGGVFELQHTFGDETRVTAGIHMSDDTPATLATILQHDDWATIGATIAVDVPHSAEFQIGTFGAGSCWFRNAVRLVGRIGESIDIVGYVLEITRERQEQLQRQQSTTLITLGEMATGMAHELNQPLASISFAAQNTRLLLRREPTDLDAIGGKIEKILVEAHRASQLIEHMRIFARNDRGPMRPISWHAVFASALEILSHKLRGCQIVNDIPPDLPKVNGTMIPMEQVLINLLSNSADAYEQGDPEAPRPILLSGFERDGYVVLRVQDRAGGIPPQVLSRMFEPFFTTKPPGKGTGLGLALAYGTIADMGGKITAANQDGGALFEIVLPVASANTPDEAGHAATVMPGLATATT